LANRASAGVTDTLVIFALSGIAYNDVLATISIIGSILLFVGAFPRAHWRYTEFGEWSLSALAFGTFFQVAMILIGVIPEKIGMLLPMAPNLVTALFASSFLLLMGRFRVRYQSMQDEGKRRIVKEMEVQNNP